MQNGKAVYLAATSIPQRTPAIIFWLDDLDSRPGRSIIMEASMTGMRSMSAYERVIAIQIVPVERASALAVQVFSRAALSHCRKKTAIPASVHTPSSQLSSAGADVPARICSIMNSIVVRAGLLKR